MEELCDIFGLEEEELEELLDEYGIDAECLWF